MRPAQVEAWTLSIVDRVRTGQPNEDARVEIKSEWPSDIAKAARRLAGHANAARGEPILWIIGLSQELGTVRAGVNDLANWYPQVSAQFDGIAPDLMVDLVIPVDSGFLVALYFETSRAPFVVKNPAQTGPVTLEVPWREGTRVRSANRSDLIRMLVPKLRLPLIEVLSASLSAQMAPLHEKRKIPALQWNAQVKLYLTPVDESRIVVPFHTIEMSFGPPHGPRIPLEGISLRPPRIGFIRNAYDDSATMNATQAEILIDGPGAAILAGEALTPADVDLTNSCVFLAATLRPSLTDSPLPVTVDLTFQGGEQGRRRWIWPLVSQVQWITNEYGERFRPLAGEDEVSD
jgi:hypothetical protein